MATLSTAGGVSDTELLTSLLLALTAVVVSSPTDDGCTSLEEEVSFVSIPSTLTMAEDCGGLFRGGFFGLTYNYITLKLFRVA